MRWYKWNKHIALHGGPTLELAERFVSEAVDHIVVGATRPRLLTADRGTEFQSRARGLGVCTRGATCFVRPRKRDPRPQLLGAIMSFCKWDCREIRTTSY
jgi:hypothetical protein